MSQETEKIESLLFLAGDAVSVSELARLIKKSEEQTQKCIDDVKNSLHGHGLAVIQAGDQVQLTTAPEVAEYLAKYIEEEAQDLSAAAAETLALVAYRGPVTRVEIDAIRGVDSRRMLRQLLARDLIRKTGDLKVPKYVISEQFLQHMCLKDVSELPQYDNLSSHDKVQQLLREKEVE